MPITAKKVLGGAVGADLDCLITTVVAVYASITLKPIFAQAHLKTLFYSSLQNVRERLPVDPARSRGRSQGGSSCCRVQAQYRKHQGRGGNHTEGRLSKSGCG